MVAFFPRSDGSTFATVVYESDLLYEYCGDGKSSGVQRASKKRIKVVAALLLARRRGSAHFF